LTIRSPASAVEQGFRAIIETIDVPRPTIMGTPARLSREWRTWLLGLPRRSTKSAVPPIGGQGTWKAAMSSAADDHAGLARSDRPRPREMSQHAIAPDRADRKSATAEIRVFGRIVGSDFRIDRGTPRPMGRPSPFAIPANAGAAKTVVFEQRNLKSEDRFPPSASPAFRAPSRLRSSWDAPSASASRLNALLLQSGWLTGVMLHRRPGARAVPTRIPGAADLPLMC